jgi:hypothetical protein
VHIAADIALSQQQQKQQVHSWVTATQALRQDCFGQAPAESNTEHNKQITAQVHSHTHAAAPVPA